MSERKFELEHSGLMWVVLFSFWLFWMQSGWYRVDCSLGIQKACDFIAAEKEYQKPAEVQK